MKYLYTLFFVIVLLATDIHSLRAQEHDIEIAGIYDRKHGREQFLDREVVERIDGCGPFDVCLLTNLSDPQSTYVELVNQVSVERVVAKAPKSVRVFSAEALGADKPLAKAARVSLCVG